MFGCTRISAAMFLPFLLLSASFADAADDALPGETAAIAELSAQPAKGIPDYYSVQTSPAFTVLGFGAEQVIRPTTPKQLAVALLQERDDGSNPQTGVAIEFAPLLLFSSGQNGGYLSLQNYKGRWLRRALSRTLLSFAFTRGTSADDPALRLAVGFRTTLLDKGDPRYDVKLDEAVRNISSSQARKRLLERQNELLRQDAYSKACIRVVGAVRGFSGVGPGVTLRKYLRQLSTGSCWELVQRFDAFKGLDVASRDSFITELKKEALLLPGRRPAAKSDPCLTIDLDLASCLDFFQKRIFARDSDNAVDKYGKTSTQTFDQQMASLTTQVRDLIGGEWDKQVKKAQEDNWNATNITIGAALTSADTSGDLGAVKNTGIAVYGTAAWGFEGMGVLEDRAHLIGHIRYNTDQFVGPALMELADAFPDDDEMDDMMAGMRDMDGMNGMDAMDEMPMTRNLLFLGGQLRFAGLSFNRDLPGPDIFLFGEGAYKRSRFADGMLDKTFRYAFGLDVRIIKGVSFQLAIGDETGSEFMRNSTFVLGDIKYSF